ncbi:MAG TPA: BTAD domain-containing putative transcriptional regulator [Caldilineaceae bacterium]|nr:BTAD domain-containing putative transcriptional regulator [Caldilineaceae bacterium]
MLYLNLLGTPEFGLYGQMPLRFRTRKAQALLIYLAVTHRSWTRDALATLFWPETDDATARKNLRDILPPLRRQLDDYLKVDDDTIALDGANPYFCDVTTFRQVLEQPLQEIETQRLADTLALYRGEFLEGYTGARISANFEMWALRERERLHQFALVGFTTLCRRQQAAGAYEAALITNRQLLKLVPWDEAAHRQQMLLLAQSGQQAAALAHFDACCQILAEELDAEPDEETVQLYEQIHAGTFNESHFMRATMPHATSSAILLMPSATKACPKPIPHNLPTPLATFIGRRKELEVATARLAADDCRLLTILGPGGMGKSALALAVGRQLIATPQLDFLDGIFWIPLADVNLAGQEDSSVSVAANATTGETMLRAIADQLNTASQVRLSSTKQLLAYLQPRRLLLILDNFEHLVAGTQVLLDLLEQSPQIKVLITSRIRLKIRGENLLLLEKLSLASVQHRAGAQPVDTKPLVTNRVSTGEAVTWQESEAIAMFVQRAQQFDPDFAITDATIAPVDQICHLVEGLPLGIELATSMLPFVNCHELAVELTESLDFLVTDMHDIPHEQRTLRAVFARSWRLLAREEQLLLARLTIFPGSFHGRAAQEIAGASLSLLSRLLDQALVSKSGTNRFTLHRTIHAFASQKLQEQPQQIPMLQQRYAHFYLTFLAEMEEGLLGASYGRTIERIQADLDNIRTAWRRAVDHRMVRELNGCINAMIWFYEQQGFFADAIDLCNQALNAMKPMYVTQQERRGTPITLLVGRLQMFWGIWSLRLGRLPQAQAAYALSCTILQEVDDTAAMAYALGFWGASLRTSDPQRSLALITEALQLAQATEALWMQAIIHQLVGEAHLFAGNYRDAETSIKTSQMLTTQVNWARGLAADQKILGRICLTRGNYRQAEEHLHKSIEIARRHHLNQFYLAGLIMLGEASRLQGHFAEAKARYMESRVLAEALGGGILISPILWEEGTLAVQCKDYGRAKILFTESRAMGLPNWWVHALPTMGWALIGLDAWSEAQEYFQVVLIDAQAKAHMPIALEAEAGLAYLALRQTDTAQQSATQHRETVACTIATLQQLRQHPAAAAQTRDQIDQLIEQLSPLHDN